MDNSLKTKTKQQWKRWLLVPGIFLSIVSIAAASTQSRELVQQGATLLTSKDFAGALAKFEAAEQADATDAQAVFFEGVALNRLNRFGNALAKLNKSGEMGAKNPDLAFEKGWALMGSGKYKEAVVQLEQYEKDHPGRGQTSEFLGRSYMGLGEDDKADAAFKEAINRDPSLAPTVHFYMAMEAERREDFAGMNKNLETVLQEAPESPLGQVLRNQVLEGGRGLRQAGKSYSIKGSAGVGWNSNVLFEGETGSEEGSFFSRITLDADYVWNRNNGDTITAGYDFIGNVYFSESDGNLYDNFFFVDYRHQFGGKWSAALRVSDNATFLGGSFYRNQIAIRPSIGYRHSADRYTELAYSLADNAYRDDPTLERLNRDGSTQTLSLSHYFALKRIKAKVRVGLFGTWNSADGDDFDYNGAGFFIGLRRELGRRIVGDIFYSYSRNDYDNPNVLAGPFTDTERRDRPSYLAMQLTRPWKSNLDLYLRYTYNTSDSNIGFYDFKQHTIAAGVNKVF